MKYQYKIIGLGYKGEQLFVNKREYEVPYPFSVGDEIWFPDNFKEEYGGGYTWKIKSIQHYVVDNFIAVYVEKI